MWIIGVSNVGTVDEGPWKGKTCLGASLVFGPEGNQVLQGPHGKSADAILYVDAELVPRPARGHEWSSILNG
jgi:hypothetical protein